MANVHADSHVVHIPEPWVSPDDGEGFEAVTIVLVPFDRVKEGDVVLVGGVSPYRVQRIDRSPEGVSLTLWVAHDLGLPRHGLNHRVRCERRMPWAEVER